MVRPCSTSVANLRQPIVSLECSSLSSLILSEKIKDRVDLSYLTQPTETLFTLRCKLKNWFSHRIKSRSRLTRVILTRMSMWTSPSSDGFRETTCSIRTDLGLHRASGLSGILLRPFWHRSIHSSMSPSLAPKLKHQLRRQINSRIKILSRSSRT